ncbi:unnamed protein product [Tilletia laevis]|uniref:Uncharacterized protein n=1 Tax=Tilletia caries TaxID=13290 RepID=A0ABN7J2I9_9BASI|nr:hypothetical protein CF336_g7264 [Tilletia laevis]CAD6892897.1 unnamed protein product [Tilletia caries]CAD6943962.1 unnamed protein product [Tilletia controversa]KAE8189338.1 hypothetical protein CF335_g6651 [Tilletia laevis]CAD6898364.1 unnamed protein product [Tilletia caries]
MRDLFVRNKNKFSSNTSGLVDIAPSSKLRKAICGTMPWKWNYLEHSAAVNELIKDTANDTAVHNAHHDLDQKSEEITGAWSKTKNDSNATAKDPTYHRLVLGKQLHRSSSN